MNYILITGATGFVGRTLCTRLLQDQASIRGTILPTETPSNLIEGIESVQIEPIGPETSWTQALAGVDAVIHLAARVHVMRDTATNPLKEFRATNTEGTITLARQAAAAGVRRFVFMSTIGVNGSSTPINKPFSETDETNPHNPYAISKHEAEQALWQISRETGMEVVIVRAPLVYGPCNPGNFLSLLKIVSKRIPLPFSSINNLRSLVYVGNLADALVLCATHPVAANKLFLVSDEKDISTPDLVRTIAHHLGQPSWLFPLPLFLLALIASFAGKSKALEQLTGSLRVNSSTICKTLGWLPPFSMEEGLRETASWFKNTILRK